jgi:PAS domain S-box-containing protein
MSGMSLTSKDGRSSQNDPARGFRLPLRQPFLRKALALCVFVVGYFFAYRYGMTFSYVTSSPFWFPDSVLLCTLLVVRPSRWWVFILAALPIRLLFAVPEGRPLWFLLATFAIDSAKGLLAALALRRFLGNPVRFETVHEFALYCLFVVLLMPAAAAFAGAGARHFLGFDYWPAWEQWFLGNVLTHLVVTPVIFCWVLGAPWHTLARFSTRWVEAGLLTIGLIATAYIAFDTEAGGTGFAEPRFYAPVPFLFWAAIRFGMLGASGAIAVITFFAVGAALQGHGPFSGHSPVHTALALQHFLLLRTAPLYLVAVLIEHKQRVEERYREVVESQTDLVSRYLPDTTLTFVNEAYCRFSGRTRQDLIGRKFLELLPEEAREWTPNHIALVAARRGPCTWEQEVLLPDGGVGWQHWVGYPIFGPNGQLEEVQAIGHDITDRKRAEQTLRENEAALRASYDRIQDLAGRLITAQEAERSRIASELHDDVNQQLAGLSIALSNVKQQLQKGRDAAVQEELARLQQRTIDLANVIRNLSHELHPGVLQHAGLIAALIGHCAEFGRQHPIEVTLSAACGVDGIPQDVALCPYRVAQEASRNVAAHAGARQAHVALRRTAAGLELTITDDGQGFDLTEARRRGGLGLISLDERARLVGGSVQINTQRQRGTELKVEIPLGG